VHRSDTSLLALVVDQPVAALGAATCLQANGFVVETLHDAHKLARTVETMRPQLVVVEPAPHDQSDVLAIVDDIVGRLGAHVMAFTTDISLAAVHHALESGCLGILPRHSSLDAFVAAARAVAAGERHLHQRALAVLVQHHQAGDAPIEPVLSSRELDVLLLVAEGFTNPTIATELDISTSTVKTHVENMLRKLSANDRAHAVSTAMRRGLID